MHRAATASRPPPVAPPTLRRLLAAVRELSVSDFHKHDMQVRTKNKRTASLRSKPLLGRIEKVFTGCAVAAWGSPVMGPQRYTV
jgi:hypothetical protein